MIWDDHETSNDTYMSGAQNHQVSSEGNFMDRKKSAMQAYYEWLPIRENIKPYRNFSYGNLVDLIILEERLEGRTKQANNLGRRLFSIYGSRDASQEDVPSLNAVLYYASDW